jgi:hypothetical protein
VVTHSEAVGAVESIYRSQGKRENSCIGAIQRGEEGKTEKQRMLWEKGETANEALVP